MCHVHHSALLSYNISYGGPLLFWSSLYGRCLQWSTFLFVPNSTSTEFWVVSIEHLRRVWHADRGRLLIRTPGPAPLGLPYVLLVETNPFPNLSLFSGLCSSNIPRYLLDFTFSGSCQVLSKFQLNCCIDASSVIRPSLILSYFGIFKNNLNEFYVRERPLDFYGGGGAREDFAKKKFPAVIWRKKILRLAIGSAFALQYLFSHSKICLSHSEICFHCPNLHFALRKLL